MQQRKVIIFGGRTCLLSDFLFLNEIESYWKDLTYSYYFILFFTLYFIGYAVNRCPSFPLFPPLPSNPNSLRQSPHHWSCPWVMHISSLASPFLILYFTSPWLFCNYLFVLLNPLTPPFSPIPPHSPPTW